MTPFYDELIVRLGTLMCDSSDPQGDDGGDDGPAERTSVRDAHQPDPWTSTGKITT